LGWPDTTGTVGDGRRLGAPDGSYDVVHASLVVHHLEPDEAIAMRSRPGRSMSGGTGSSWARERRSSCWRPPDGARRRGARPYAEVLGYAASSDAHHMVQPRPDGRDAARAACGGPRRRRRRRRGDRLRQRHASSTPIGDVAEARAIAATLGGRAASVPVSGTKALYGHPLGASDAIEAAICALAIRDGWAPASVNLDTPDEAAVDLLPGLLMAGRPGTYRRVLSTSFGFGALNAALVLGAPDGVAE